MDTHSNWPVLAVVAVVALASLVFLFQSSTQGALVGTIEGVKVYHVAGIDFDRQVGWDIGLDLAANWNYLSHGDEYEYCSRSCGQRCASALNVRNKENCKDACETSCVAELLKIRGYTK